MWPVTFEERLQYWHSLRQSCCSQAVHDLYLTINDWWFKSPMVNRTIKWEDFPAWPNPWDLLEKDGLCDLARALGIVYTLMMLDNSYQQRLHIVRSGKDNLVQIDDGKYILNWCPGELLNINSQQFTPLQYLNCNKLYSLTD